MARNPRANIEPIQMTLDEFNVTSLDFIGEGEPTSIVKHTIAGLMKNGDTLYTPITINARQGADVLDSESLTQKRDFDSLVGVTTTLPFQKALSVFPIANFKDTLKKDNHLKGPVLIDGLVTMIPFHKIPNMGFGTVELRHKTRLFLPGLYVAGASASIPARTLAQIYDDCLRPTVQHVIPESLSHWPVSYAAAMQRAKDNRGQFHFGTLDVPAFVLDAFSTTFLAKLAEAHPTLSGAYFLHEFRGMKGGSIHNIDDEVDMDAAMDEVTSSLGPIDLDDWVIDVAIEIGQPGFIVQWLTNAHRRILEHILPSLSAAQITKKLNSSKFLRDHSAQLADFAGFRILIGSKGDADGVIYLNVYHTEKSLHYTLHEGLFSLRSGKDLLPGKLIKLVDDIERISTTLTLCQGLGGLEGSARFEVRMPLRFATSKHLSLPYDLIRDCTVGVPVSSWWTFKFVRLAGLYIVLQDHLACEKAAALVHARMWPATLTLGVTLIGMFNSLFYRPSNERQWTALYNFSAFQEPEDDPMDSESDDDSDFDQSTRIWEDRGAYFVNDIVVKGPAYRLPASEPFSEKYLSFLYGVELLENLDQQFNVARMLITGPAKTKRVGNRKRLTKDIRSVRSDLEYIAPIFSLTVRLRPTLRMTGSDVEEFENENATDDLDPQGDINDILTLIWLQFPHDVFAVSANQKRQYGASHSLFTSDERETSTIERFSSLQFTGVFSSIYFKYFTSSEWELLFDKYFPPKDVGPRVKNTLQNFPCCRYYQMWFKIMQRLSTHDAKVARKAVRKLFFDLRWAPAAESDRMWSTRVPTKGAWHLLPKGTDPKAPHPHIAINSVRQGGRKVRLVYVEPEESTDGGEE